MAIKLSWTNRNTQSVTTSIYRGDAPLDRNNLGTPLVVLTNNETSWVDTTAAQGSTYYYVFKTSNGSETIVSRNQKQQAAETRGPGSNVFQYGDRELGLYDVIGADMFISAANLNTLVGGATSGVVANSNWYKLARKGKVFMVPERVIGYTTSYNALNALGLVTGKTVQINGFTWKVRLMRGWREDDSTVPLPSNALNTFDTATYSQTCEFNDFVYPMCAPTPVTQRLPNWSQVGVTSLYSSYGNYVLTQELSAEGDRCFVRLLSGISTNERTKLSAGSVGQAVLPGTSNSNVGWWPVLELVEV